ncbi:MAG: DUF86 domain-containing protein [Phycisphaeraceae bacterium]
MPPERSWRMRVDDILRAAEEARQLVDGFTYDRFAQDLRTNRAVTATIAIIGEASRHIPEEVKTAHPEVPWPQMYGMRNIIVHSYWHIDLEVVWHTVTKDVPQLVAPLRALLDAEEPDEGTGP